MEETKLQTTRTPEIIAGEIRTFTASMLNNIIEIGRRLCEAKELLPYGEFGSWVKNETGYSASTANNFMRLYQEYGASQGSLFGAEVDSQTFGKLSYTKALALLQVPREEREAVAQELDAEHLSTRELEAAIRERDEARKREADLERDLNDTMADSVKIRQERDDLRRQLDGANEAAIQLEREAAEARDRIRELEARPIDVAVETVVDQAAIDQAVKAALDEAAKQEAQRREALQKRVEAAEKKAAKAQEAAAKTEEARKQLEQTAGEAAKRAAEKADAHVKAEAALAEEARQEAQALRRQLETAATGADVAALLARQAQESALAALERIGTMRKDGHPETADKLLAGMEQIFSALLERVRQAKEGVHD